MCKLDLNIEPLPSSSKTKLNVVIVGAGDSSRYVLSNLNAQKNARSQMYIKVIRANSFCEVDYYATYAITRPNQYDSNATLSPPKGADEIVYGVATHANDGTIFVESGSAEQKNNHDGNDDTKQIQFDILIAATGSTIPFIQPTPGQSLLNRKAEIESLLKVFSASSKYKDTHIIICGGGTVGVEFAGDVLESINNDPEINKKKVTIVSRSNRLLADQEESVSSEIKEHLETLGATLLFENEVVSHSETKIILDSEEPFEVELKNGQKLECVAYIQAFGNGPNTQWLKETRQDLMSPLPKCILNSVNQIQVNSYLQSSVYPKLFAIGAVSSSDDIITVPHIEQQAKTIASNVASIVMNRNYDHQSDHVPSPLKSDAPLYVKAGHDNFVLLVTKNLPFPVGTIFFEWCGLPFNLLIPCFFCGAATGIVDPMLCGWCCDGGKSRSSRGALAKTMKNMQKMQVLALKSGYTKLGSTESIAKQKMIR